MKETYGRYGTVKSFVSPLFFVILLFIVLIFAHEVKADNSYYANLLVKSALEKKLHEDRYWWILLHYKKSLFGIESLIDDPKFFLSAEGKYNPKSELEATIRAFFFRKNAEDADHPTCRFIARYNWLKEKLHIDDSKLPVAECEQFNRLIDQLKPQSASIVFPTIFMNSPASMFGHTLINIETDYKSKLLSHAVNYSALTDESKGLFFAVKGLFGLYKGYYSILPYYQKIQEYSDISQRDIWEYRLNLTESEVKRMVTHIWELRNIYADYYFFDENCSYNLMFLLESARPSLSLTEQFPLWVLPIDTIKAIKSSELIDTVDYRPSRATKIKHKLSCLSERDQNTVLKILNREIESQAILNLEIKKDDQIRIIDLLVDCIQYEYAKKKISKSRYQDILLEALKARSTLGKPDENLYNLIPPPQPDEGHESNRLSVGLGIKGNTFFQEVGFRPVFTDLLDTDYVHNEGAQIEFGDILLRYYFSDKKLELEQLDIIDIVSISPRNKFFRPISWKVNTGLNRRIMSDGDESLIYRLNTGGGMAFHNNYLGLYYILMETELDLSGGFADNYCLGVGASAGLVKSITSSWKCHLSAKQIYFELGDTHRASELSLLQNFRLSRNSCIRLAISRERVFDFYQTEASLNFHIFF